MVNLALTFALQRPLVLLDLETTGALDTDRIIQIAATMYYADKEPLAWKTYINPEIPVPIEVQRVHGITDAMIAAAPTFADIAAEFVRKVLTNVDFAGQGVTFDLKMMRSECKRVGVEWDWERTDSRIIDTLRIVQVKEPRDLSSLYERFMKRKLEGAHDAGVDVEATAEILTAQMREFSDLPREIAALSDLCFPKRRDYVDQAGKFIWRNGEACVAFGNKWKGVPLRQVDRGYLRWMLDPKQTFPPDVQMICREALEGRYPEGEK
jgi:DNA polymerase-3 subunit epsilon